MKPPESLWSRVALAAVAAGSAACSPAPEQPPGPAPVLAIETSTEGADGLTEPATAPALVSESASGGPADGAQPHCEGMPPAESDAVIDPFAGGCPLCGMG